MIDALLNNAVSVKRSWPHFREICCFVVNQL